MRQRQPYARNGLPWQPRPGTATGSLRPSAILLTLAAVLTVVGLGFGFVGTRLSGSVSAPRPAAAVGGPVSAALLPPPDAPAAAAQQPAPPVSPPQPSRAWEGDASQGVIYNAELASQLDGALAEVDGHVGVAVKDLATGQGAVLDANREQPSASLFKLPVLFSVFAADLPFSQELLITDAVRSYDLGTLELGSGETLTVAEALERMVTISDNVSAIMLADAVGGARVNANMAALGLDRTHYSAERLTTSADDMLALLERIARGNAVSRVASADMLHLLLRQRVNDRLPRLLPAEAQVAHKTGNLPGIVNDVGIIYGPHSTFIVAGMIDQTTDDAAAADGLARVAQAAYTYFEGQPAVVDRPGIPAAPDRPIPPVWREPRPVAVPTAVNRVEAAGGSTRGPAVQLTGTAPARATTISNPTPTATGSPTPAAATPGGAGTAVAVRPPTAVATPAQVSQPGPTVQANQSGQAARPAPPVQAAPANQPGQAAQVSEAAPAGQPSQTGPVPTPTTRAATPVAPTVQQRAAATPAPAPTMRGASTATPAARPPAGPH